MNSPHSVLDDLPFCLARATLAFRRFDDLTLRAMGIQSMPPGMASILHALKERDGCPVNDLVRMTNIPNSTMTGLLNSLERKGYIIRTRNPADGRSRIIRLRSGGIELYNRLLERHRSVMTLFQEALSEQESSDLKRLLDKITRHMADHPPGAPLFSKQQ